MALDPKGWSRTITDGRDRAPARAMLKAVGYSDDDLARPIIGIANTWIETMPCNLNLRKLAAKVKEGVRAAGGTPMEFNTVAISDGVTMGTEGMKASLISREVIADSIELCGRGYMFDGIIALVGCDKTLPGAALAIARLDVPSIILYGGTIMPGRHKERDITLQNVFEAVGANAAGRMSDAELREIEDHACPGAGACGGQFTANTMATAMEFIGLSPSSDHRRACHRSAQGSSTDRQSRSRIVASWTCVRKGLQAHRDILTREALRERHHRVSQLPGARTNAVLHLIAHRARARHPPAPWRTLIRSPSRTPFICRSGPRAGKYAAKDVDQEAGGIALIARQAPARPRSACMTSPTSSPAPSLTIEEEARLAEETPNQPVIHGRWANPLKPTGGLVILRGNLAPEGCVVKVAGHERHPCTRGPARVFNSRRGLCHAAGHSAATIQPNDVIL